MYCFQCQEAAKNEACTVRGVCGKPEETADLQDLLIYVAKGIAVYGEKLKDQGTVDKDAARFIGQALFVTVTNTAWDDEVIIDWIKEALEVRAAVREKVDPADLGALPDCATWKPQNDEQIMAKALSDEVRITSTEDEDVRSLRELLIIGCKGIAAYADHAAVLGYEQDEIDGFLMEALASTTKDLEIDEMMAMVMKAGDMAVKTMALLDEAHTATYGHPEMTEVNIGVGNNPGILISGH
ncbi:MAG: hydroxylamine reductase, partial [Anaerolineae bacterium]|nr:hydroxylamine reductase [Anaerolineae bacterium]